MTISPDRIEAAARAIIEIDWFVAEDQDRQAEAAKIILEAAFPELASGSHWLAPREATEEMVHAMYCAYGADDQPWHAMRDAYLNATTPEGT